MSAFLFTISDKKVKNMTDDELRAELVRAKEIVDSFDWSKFKQCHYDSDFAAGASGTVAKIEQELKLRSGELKPEEKERILVIGYNPPEEE